MEASSTTARGDPSGPIGGQVRHGAEPLGVEVGDRVQEVGVEADVPVELAGSVAAGGRGGRAETAAVALRVAGRAAVTGATRTVASGLSGLTLSALT